MSDAKLEIRVLTWPPLWQYWPAYLAMARAMEELPGLRFNLELPPGETITDVSIRRAFLNEAEKGHLVMALCEPYELDIPGRDTMIRRLPVLSRQPLWVVGRTHFFVGPDSYVARNSGERGAGPPSEPAQVWTYPEGTTSGNFARSMIRRLSYLAASRDIEERDLNTRLSEERARAATLGEDEFLATFTPWHRILESSELNGDMLFGPSSEITALQFPDVQISIWEKLVPDVVAAHLVGVLNELAQTQGVDVWLNQYVNDNWHSVQQFLKRSPSLPSLSLDERETAIALREYTLLGCYFPYRAMNSAMTVEIQKRVLDVFDAASRRAAAEASRTISDFFVATPGWSELTLEARCHVWNGTPKIWRYISHNEATGDPRDVAPILRDRLARTSATAPPYLLSSLVRGLPPRCHYASDKPGTRIMCVKDTGGTAASHRGGHCAACSLAGSPGAVARSAAEVIAHHLGIGVNYAAQLRKEACPLCFDDVAGLVKLFNAEGKDRTDSKTMIDVRVYNEFSGDKAMSDQQECRIVFAIWRKDTTSALPTRPGNTGPRIQEWIDLHTEARRQVTWAGAWWLKDGAFHALSAKKWHELEHGGPFNDWEEADPAADPSALRAARADFESGGFGFGYVAVFRVKDGEHSQATAGQGGGAA